MNMPKVTAIFAVALIILGIVGYVATEMVSVTALIPAFFGIVLLALALMARKENLRRHAMHAASVLGVIGFAGTFSGLLGLVTMMTGGEVANPAAVIGRAVMAVLCLAFVALCVKSFLDARRLRTAEA